MGSNDDVREPIRHRIAKKAPIMVVSTRFGEWPLYGPSPKQRPLLHLPQVAPDDRLRNRSRKPVPAAGLVKAGSKPQQATVYRRSVALRPLESTSRSSAFALPESGP